MLLFSHIANGTVVNKEACAEMIRILTDQQFKDIIGARLPGSVKVTSKSGSIEGVCHDSGIVFLPDGRKYVVVLLSAGISDNKKATEVLSEVSRVLYDHVTDRSLLK